MQCSDVLMIEFRAGVVSANAADPAAGEFERKPHRKQLLSSGPAAIVLSRLVAGRMAFCTANEMAAHVEHYAAGDGADGLTETVMRRACGLEGRVEAELGIEPDPQPVRGELLRFAEAVKQELLRTCVKGIHLSDLIQHRPTPNTALGKCAEEKRVGVFTCTAFPSSAYAILSMLHVRPWLSYPTAVVAVPARWSTGGVARTAPMT